MSIDDDLIITFQCSKLSLELNNISIKLLLTYTLKIEFSPDCDSDFDAVLNSVFADKNRLFQPLSDDTVSKSFKIYACLHICWIQR